MINNYLKDKLGISLTEEAIEANATWLKELEILYNKEKKEENAEEYLDLLNERISLVRKDVREMKASIVDRINNMKSKATFDLSLLEVIKEIVNNHYNLDYKLITTTTYLKNQSKQVYLLVNSNIAKLPEYESPEFWEYVSNENIFVLGNIVLKKGMPKNISLYNDKKSLKLNPSAFSSDAELAEKIFYFLNDLILLKIDKNKDELTTEEIYSIYNKVINERSKTKKISKTKEV